MGLDSNMDHDMPLRGQQSAGRAVLILWAMLGVGSGCCDAPTAPCLPWVEIGETYEIELVEHFILKNESEASEFFPYEGHLSPETSCGPGFDLQVGDTIQLRASSHADDFPYGGCQRCLFTAGKFSSSEIVWDSGNRTVQGIQFGPPQFYQRSYGATRNGCSGEFQLGVAPLNLGFSDTPEQPVASNFMLFRYFIPDPGQACTSIGGTRRLCWDDWVVRIQDSDGRMISKDIAAPIDAGLLDGALEP